MSTEAKIQLLGHEFLEFKSKDEYDQCSYSWAGCRREYQHRTYKGPIVRFANDPDQYPCLGIIGPTNYRSDGPDEITILYFYDYNLQEVE